MKTRGSANEQNHTRRPKLRASDVSCANRGHFRNAFVFAIDISPPDAVLGAWPLKHKIISGVPGLRAPDVSCANRGHFRNAFAFAINISPPDAVLGACPLKHKIIFGVQDYGL